MQATDAELVEALARRRLGLPPPPFAVHELDSFFHYNSHPFQLYERFGGDDADVSSGECVYFFSDQIGIGAHDWKVASGNQRVFDADAGGGGEEIGCKLTLVFDDSRWGIQQGTTRWIMDEFDAAHDDRRGEIPWRLYDLRLYRLRRQQGPPRRQQEPRRVGGFRRLNLLV
ncbi:hypothetical protein EJB05_09824 [Eragrostis curvula]|uniref:NAC domain-containing protein n=1 Tax=Eragrostis curvula TaxID=38414 RepID=A0A5J9W7L6_9POAL|nr:hypothetical protein EJB05_09824 [Eragrostis curvula]